MSAPAPVYIIDVSKHLSGPSYQLTDYLESAGNLRDIMELAKKLVLLGNLPKESYEFDPLLKYIQRPGTMSFFDNIEALYYYKTQFCRLHCRKSACDYSHSNRLSKKGFLVTEFLLNLQREFQAPSHPQPPAPLRPPRQPSAAYQSYPQPQYFGYPQGSAYPAELPRFEQQPHSLDGVHRPIPMGYAQLPPTTQKVMFCQQYMTQGFCAFGDFCRLSHQVARL